MGRKDVITKKYISDNEKFADIFNYYLYDGEKVIRSEDLEERDITELAAVLTNDGSIETKEKLRDVLKQCVIKQSDKFTFILLGAESQSEVHYAMPVKNGIYDFMDYASQVEEKAKEHKDKKDLRGAEFLSGYSKCDKIKPIITLTVYFGSGEWDGPRSLHEMFEVKDENILKYVPDYKLNLLVPREVENPEKFSTDMKYIIEFLKVGKDKKEVKRLLAKNREAYSHLSTDTAMVLKEYAGIKMKEKEEKENMANVCQGIADWIQDERMEAQKETQIEMSIKYYVEGYLPLEKALEECKLSEDEFLKKVEEYKAGKSEAGE